MSKLTLIILIMWVISACFWIFQDLKDFFGAIQIIKKIELGQLLVVALQLIAIATVAYFLNKKLSADLKRREMLSDYFGEAKEALTDLNDRVLKNAEAPADDESEYIYRKLHSLSHFGSEIYEKCSDPKVRRLFSSFPESYMHNLMEYWQLATEPVSKSEQLDVIDELNLLHDEIQSNLTAWQLGLYFN